MSQKHYLKFCSKGKKPDGFTLRNGMTNPEIFIILLSIVMIAALCAPKFSEAKERGKLSRLVSQLAMMRQQIELYKVQHNELLPGQKEKGGEITEEEFVKALTESDGVYGPYLKSIPENPFNGLKSVRMGSFNLSTAAGAGWFFNYKTGDFKADDLQFHRAY